MSSWRWTDLSSPIQEGIGRGDPAVLGPLGIWLHERIQRSRTYNDDCDLAQAIYDELRRMMGSEAGRRKLGAVKQMPAFLKTLADRLRRRERRSSARRAAALHRFVRVGRVPAPTEHLDAEDLARQIIDAVSRLDAVAREVLNLHLQAMSRSEIAKRVWPTRTSGRETDRVRGILQRVRSSLRRAIMGTRDESSRPGRSKKDER